MRYRVAPAVLAAALLSLLFTGVAHADDLVPDVVGLKVEEAQSMVSGAGFEVRLRYDAGKPDGVVFWQDPGGLATRAKGALVTLSVGGLAPAAAVPDTRGPIAPPADAPENPAPPAGDDDLGPPPGGTPPVAPDPAPTPDPVPTPDPMPAAPADDKPPAGNLPKDPLDLGPPPTGNPPKPIPTPDPTPGPVPTPDPIPLPDPAPRPDSIPVPGPAVNTDPGLDALPFAPRINREGSEIPDVLGQSRANARRQLGEWNVVEELTLSVPSLAGTVVDQWPVPGRTMGAGETVIVVIAATDSPSNRHRSVPVVIGKSFTDIRGSLERFGFNVLMRKVRSRAGTAGKAVWQQPRPGSLAPKGSEVIVHVGLGPMRPRTGRRVPPPVPTNPTPINPDPDPGSIDTPPVAPPVNPIPDPLPPVDPPVNPLPDPLPPVNPTPPPVSPTPPAVPDGPPAGVPAVPDLGPPPTADRPGTVNPAPKPPVNPTPLPPVNPTPPPVNPTPTPPPVMRSPLTTPTLLSPPAGESYPRAYGATFEWSTVSGAKAYEWQLESEQPSGAWRSIDKATVQGTRHRPDRVQKGRYRWRVRATSGDRTSDWSRWFRLYMY